MTVAKYKDLISSEDELSEVDERFLDKDELLLPDIGRTKQSGRPKVLKTTGVNARDKAHGRTALHKASAKGDLSRVTDLIARGADVLMLDNAGVSPLHEAATKGHAEVVRYLLSKGAPASVRDIEGDYPLLDAAQNDHLEVCEILLENDANPTLQNTKGCSALSEAEEGPVKDLLRQYSDKFESPGQNRMKISDIVAIDTSTSHAIRARPRLSQINLDANGARIVDENGRDQLHLYVLDDEDELVEQFLEIQDGDFQDHFGDTPLHSAARLGNAHICGLLLDHRAGLSIRNKKGNTPLHEAAYKSRNRAVIVALLDAGASAISKNNDDLMPWQVAANEIAPKCAEANLLQKSAEKEGTKLEAREKKRAIKREKRERMETESTRTSPAVSPHVARERGSIDSTSTQEPVAVTPPVPVIAVTPIPTEMTKPNDISMTVATTAPPQIVTSTQTVTAKSGRSSTQFLTELRTGISQIDSSVRGSPLPPPMPTTNGDHRPKKSLLPPENVVESQKRPSNGTSPHDPKRIRTSESQDTTVADAILKASQDIVKAIETQSSLLQALLDRLK